MNVLFSDSKTEIKPEILFEPDDSSLSLSLDSSFSEPCSGNKNDLVTKGCSLTSSFEFGREPTRVHGRFEEICSNYEKKKSPEKSSSSVFSRLGSKLNVSEEQTPGKLIATVKEFYSRSSKEQSARSRVRSRPNLRYPGSVGSGRMELFPDAPLEHISRRTDFSVQSLESFEPSSSDFIERYPLRTSRTGPRASSTITSSSCIPSFTTRELEVPLRTPSTVASASFRSSFSARELYPPVRASSQFSVTPSRVSSSASVAPQTFPNPNLEWISYNQQPAVQPPTWRNPESLNSASPFYSGWNLNRSPTHSLDQDLRQVMNQRRQRDPYFSPQEHQDPGFSRDEDITDFWDFKSGRDHRQVHLVNRLITGKHLKYSYDWKFIVFLHLAN